MRWVAPSSRTRNLCNVQATKTLGSLLRYLTRKWAKVLVPGAVARQQAEVRLSRVPDETYTLCGVDAPSFDSEKSGSKSLSASVPSWGLSDVRSCLCANHHKLSTLAAVVGTRKLFVFRYAAAGVSRVAYYVCAHGYFGVQVPLCAPAVLSTRFCCGSTRF